LTFFLPEYGTFDTWFQVSIKVTGEGHELFVKTFHKIWHYEVARKCKRADVLRPDKE
jgi:hypothetical protein